MHNTFENGDDCIEVDRGGGVASQAGVLRVDAGLRVATAVAVDAPSLRSGVAAEPDNSGYQVVTRAKGRKASNAKIARGENELAHVFQHAQPVETSKKRRAEDQIGNTTRGTGVDEQIAGLKALLIKLIDQNEAREGQVQKQIEELHALRCEMERTRKLLQQNKAGRATYAAALASGTQAVQLTGNTHANPQDSPHQSQRMRLEDDKCAITINTSRFKGEKTDFRKMKLSLQGALDESAALQGEQVRCIRQLSGERINVVFNTADAAAKAKEHPGWLEIAMPAASVKSEAWYPVKCDMVVKSAVLDETVEGGRALRREVCDEFARDNMSEGLDFTAMKASWLCRSNPEKKTGSLVVWLKCQSAAAHLLRTGQALFGGAYGAFCSRYKPCTANKLCFNCNTYGHLQGACKKPTKCGICAGAHQTRECRNTGTPKCAVCAGSHRSSDWQCKPHPQHKKYLAAHPKTPGRVTPPAQVTDIEMDNPATSL